MNHPAFEVMRLRLALASMRAEFEALEAAWWEAKPEDAPRDVFRSGARALAATSAALDAWDDHAVALEAYAGGTIADA